MRYFTLLLCTCLLAGSCTRYTAENLPEERIRFGGQGGFAGTARMYELLLGSGRLLFDNELTGEVEKVGKLTPAEMDAVRGSLAAIDFTGATGASGNYTSSLTYYGNDPATTIRWSGPGNAPSPEVKLCYDTLMDATRRLRAAD